MANKKNWYYVLVFTDEGPMYVTDLLPNHYAKWEGTEVPKSFTKTMAEDVVMGLRWNFYTAVMVCSSMELDCQPYAYDYYKVKFERRGN